MNEDRQAVRVGGVVLLVLGLAVAAVLALQGRHLGRGIRLHVQMARVAALQVGAKVRLAGLVLGGVEDIRLTGHGATIDLWIEARHAWLLRQTTDFFISQEGLLGEPYLAIAPRPGSDEPGPALAAGATVRGVDPPQMDQLLATSYHNLEAITTMFREGMPERQALRTALDDLSRTLDGLEAPPWSALGRLAAAARGYGALRAPVVPPLRLPADLRPRLDAIAAAAARVAATTDDPRAVRLAIALAGAGALADRARAALAAADALRALVASGRGTLGAFLKDVEIFDEMKEMTKTMKRQPWLSVGHPDK
jgi:phospholipid/cholesterol/gamma-HCH transport system substrate-binding protein